MRRIILAVLAGLAVAACRKNSDVAMGRDSTIAAADSSYALNDRPAASGTTTTPPAAPPAAAPRPSGGSSGGTSTAGTVTLAAGAPISGTLDQIISSRTSKVGEKARVTVAADVKNAAGAVVIPAGSSVELTITAIEPSRDKNSTGKLTLAVTGITVRGTSYRIEAEVSSVTSSLKGRGVGTTEAGKVAVGTAVGAVAGRVIGGGKTGTIIGAVVGAAAGAAVATETANRDVVVDAGSTVVVTLTEPLRVAAR
jgi:hypothetical protein